MMKDLWMGDTGVCVSVMEGGNLQCVHVRFRVEGHKVTLALHLSSVSGSAPPPGPTSTSS
eukprot:m.35796 g.35796  ORF g.35796 m.35796 type:complete len:60 (+) comp12808_c0_seq1:222-401(+)